MQTVKLAMITRMRDDLFLVEHGSLPSARQFPSYAAALEYVNQLGVEFDYVHNGHLRQGTIRR